jgi:polysaccharide export outer membrane protein
MGRSFPILIARAASIFLAGMLLFMMINHARAENFDGYGLKPLEAGDTADYGLKPLPGAPAAAAAPAYTPAPAYTAPPPAYGYNATPAPAPAYTAPAAMPAGFTPAAQYGASASPYQAAPAAPYGYRSGDGMTDRQAARPMPAYPQYPTMAQANGYYPTLAGQQPAMQQAAYQAGPGIPGYVLGPGDKIKLTVFGETDLSGDFTIDGTGLLALPLIGQLRAAGYSAAQLEQTIGSALSQGYLKSPRVSVEVATYRPFYIIGAVNRPGEYPYVNHMNALNAIALAGGYQSNAVESVVFIRREGSNREEEMPTDRTTAVYPGDVVRVHFTFLSDAMSVFSPLTGAAGIGIAAATLH